MFDHHLAADPTAAGPEAPHQGEDPAAEAGLFNVRMRASKNGHHISGAERLVPADMIAAVSTALTQRALTHPKGTPDFISVKAQALAQRPLRLKALPVSEHAADGTRYVQHRLRQLGVTAVAEVVAALYTTATVRGAQLLDAATGAPRHPDPARGVRVSTMDSRPAPDATAKNHFLEALTLATKVAHHPAVVAELCISDDPHYTTGYLATAAGYERLHDVKEPGSAVGTRVFILRPGLPPEELAELIDYLEHTPVLVECER